MFSNQSAYERFVDIIRGPDGRIPLAEAALVIATEFRGGNPIASDLRRIANWASRCRGFTLNDTAQYFVEGLGFRGDSKDPAHPRNLLLDAVIEARRGGPISLGILLMEISERNGRPLDAISVPGAFLLREYETGKYVTPFFGSQILTQDQVWRLAQIGAHRENPRNWDRPLRNKQILLRLLTDLKLSFLERQQYDRAAAVQEKMLIINPGRAQEYRDLGVISASAGDLRTACRYLGEYLTRRPDAADATIVRHQLQMMADTASSRN
jgi:regulator of sirC expression with transglutaminase-like and TPR domain